MRKGMRRGFFFFSRPNAEIELTFLTLSALKDHECD